MLFKRILLLFCLLSGYAQHSYGVESYESGKPLTLAKALGLDAGAQSRTVRVLLVFVVEGAVFKAREVELGTKDRSYVEVMSGPTAEDRYVAFLLKAELGKGQVQDSD
jgi:hypothetical protein